MIDPNENYYIFNPFGEESSEACLKEAFAEVSDEMIAYDGGYIIPDISELREYDVEAIGDDCGYEVAGPCEGNLFDPDLLELK